LLAEPKERFIPAVHGRSRCAEQTLVMNFTLVAGAFLNHSLSLLIVNKQLRLDGEKPFCAA
jgi:hypothetical protein